MKRERLEKFAALLEADANDPQGATFNLRGWAGTFNSKTGPNWTFDKITDQIPINCGTTACALGLAAISGIFKDEGLTFRIGHEGNLLPVYLDPSKSKMWMGYEAAQKFFDISSNTAYRLLSPDYYPETLQDGSASELEVARRIRLLLSGTSLDTIFFGYYF